MTGNQKALKTILNRDRGKVEEKENECVYVCVKREREKAKKS